MGLVLVSAVDFSVIYELTDMYIALICTGIYLLLVVSVIPLSPALHVISYYYYV